MYSNEIVNAVRLLKNKGFTFNDISAQMNLSKRAVQSILSRKAVNVKRKTGPKKKIQKKEALMLKREINSLIDEGVKVNSSKIRRNTGIMAGRETVRKFITNMGYK